MKNQTILTALLRHFRPALQLNGMPPWRHRVAYLAVVIVLILLPQRAFAADPKWAQQEHTLTLAEPWWCASFSVVRHSGDSESSGDRWIKKSGSSPKLYIDGNYIGELYWELVWYNFSDDNKGLAWQRSNDGWWGNTYTKTVNGVTYTVKFWDPKHSQSTTWVGIAVHIDKVVTGSEHSLEIKGYWGTSESSCEEKSLKNTIRYNTSDFTGLFPESGISASRTNASTISIKSNLNSSYKTTVRTVDGNVCSNNGGAYYTGVAGSSYSKQSSFTLSVAYNDLSSTTYGNRTVWFQRSAEVTPPAVTDKHDETVQWPTVTFYKWSSYASLPDFVRCSGESALKIEPDMWNKKVALSWTADASDNHCTAGTWSVYRYPGTDTSSREVVESGILYSTTNFTDTDTDLEYDTQYTYEVAFIPTGGDRSDRLTVKKTTSIVRSFTIKKPSAKESGKTIVLSWQSEQFVGSGPYTFNVMYTSTTDAKKNPTGWKSLGTVSASTSSGVTYTYTHSAPEAETTYYYKVQVTMLKNKTFESDYVTCAITATSKVTAMTATKGDYTGVVKLSWDVDQVGTTATKFVLYRKEKGENTSWATIYSTSGTETTYFYEDNTALPGKYYDYRVETTKNGLLTEEEGFCRATGVVSGRISYGTGTAVGDARVDLRVNDDDGGNYSQFCALYSDKAGGGVRTSDEFGSRIPELFNGKDFTVQMLVNPNAYNDRSEPTLFSIGDKLSFRLRKTTSGTAPWVKVYYGAKNDIQYNIPIYFNTYNSLTASVKDGVITFTAITPAGNIQTSTLNIGTLTYEKTMTKTVNGKNTTVPSTISFGESLPGYIDEMRVFVGKALTKEEILKNYNHTLSGTEDSLLIYWPVDEGIYKQSTAYDYSKTGGVANGNHGIIGSNAQSVSDADKIPPRSILSLFANTDSIGNYVIRGVPFVGEGTNYTVMPSKGVHEFSPTYLTRYVSASSLVHSGVDFTDVSSFSVKGNVYYEGTNYPVEGCTFYVDGDVCSREGKIITSDEKGEFTISVPIGRHYIEVKKDGHTFASNGRYPEDPDKVGETVEYTQNVTGLLFTDKTLVNFSGRVIGGDIEGNKPIGFAQSTNNIGQAKIVLTPRTDTYSLNVVDRKTGTVIEKVVNTDTVRCQSGNSLIKSEAYRGGGDTNSKNIYILTDKNTGEFSAMVPPLKYDISPITLVRDSLVQITSVKKELDMSNTQYEVTDTLTADDGSEEYYTYNYRLRQTYHSAPTFVVTQKNHDDGAFGVKTYSVTENDKTVEVSPYTVDDAGNVTYKYNDGAIFVSEDTYTFNIKAYENYENKDADAPVGYNAIVPLENLEVSIANQLSSEQAVYTTEHTGSEPAGSIAGDTKTFTATLDSLGCASYVWKAGLANITAPYTRTLEMSYNIDGKDYTGLVLKGIILGSLPSGSNFVTGGPDLIQMILRDPPGTNSYSSWTKGSVTSTTTTKGKVWDSSTNVTNTCNFGPDMKTATGVGVAIITETKAVDSFIFGVNVAVQGESANSWNTTFSNSETISTSDQPEFVGANGDVFMGLSNNIIYGLATNLDFRIVGDDVELNTKQAWNTGLQFTTAFRYTANYIENVLIPNLESMRNGMLKTVDQSEYDATTEVAAGSSPVYLTTLDPDDENFGSDNHDKDAWGTEATKLPSQSGKSYKMVLPHNDSGKLEVYTDSVLWCNNQIDIWEKALAFNEEEKVKAYKKRETYLDRNVSFDVGVSVTDTQTKETSDISTYTCTVVGSAVLSNVFGLEINGVGMEIETSTQTGGGTHWESEETTTETSEFSYTLAEDGDDDAITVDIFKYGNYGPIFRTRGGQTSGPYEGEVQTKYYQPGTTIMEATMQIEKPVIDVERAIVNDVPSGSAANFTLVMTNQSETSEDVYYKLLLIDDEASNSAQVNINGLPLTESRIIKIPAGETVTKTLQLYQTDLSVLKFENVGIVLASQTQYDGTSTWDQIADTVYITANFVPSSSPVAMALDHTTINSSTGTDLKVSFSDFDRTYKNLKAFRIQYKKQGSTDWTQVKEYVIDKKDLDDTNALLPTEGSTVTFNLPMKAYPDGEYVFRVLSVTKNGTENEVTRSSEEIAVVKDVQRPSPLGQPSPSNGILNVGDDISLTFNENILKGELAKDLNFLVTGVLNGAEVDHGTALRMDNTDETASTEAPISLAGKDFSIDSWVRISGSGTLISHGNGASKFTLAVDEDSKLVVGIGSDTYTSTNPLPTDCWSFLSLSYAAKTNGGVINAAVAYDDSKTELFGNQPVASYEGSGTLSVGRKIQGAIHELTLWDEAHDLSTALANRLKTKNPSTAHLIGYWKMNEGEGTDITDYARNRHMYMPDATWYLNNDNKAVALDGSSHLDFLTAEVSPLSTDNCAIEFWMRADSQQGEAQIMQAGDVSLWTTTDGLLRLTTSGNTYEAGTATILDNAWHHIALNILRTGNAAVYVDGLRTFATSASNVGQTASDYLIMGSRRTNTDGVITYDRAFKGEIDEVRVWNATLGADIIKERSHQRLTGTEAGLVAYYPFETKSLDNFGQVVTQTTADDICEGRHSATYGTALTFTDEAPALRQKPIETNVSFNFTASDNVIVITVDEDAAAIEGCTLHFTVKGVSDVNGNKSSAVTWSAFVNRNELSWAEASLAATKHVSDEATLSATIVNKGAQQQMWTLSGMPSWLKASASQGTTEALAQTQLTFTVSKSAPIGKHEQTLYLTGNEGLVTPLVLTIAVTGDVPDWSVDQKLYDGTMNLIGSLSILGVPSSDSDDMVAAFVDGECRGVAHPVYNTRYDSYFVMLDIYGNADDDKRELTFRAYDASTGTVYSRLTTGEDYAFVFDQFLGKYSAPVLLQANDIVEQNQKLGTGWNWTSLYVVPEDLSASVVYAPVAPDADIVKSKSAFLSSDGTVWRGKTFDVDVRNMYKVHMTADRTLALTGRSATAEERTITVQPGWNWIGYNCLYTLSVADAFAGIDPQDGDIVKGQAGFAMFDGYEWNGSLAALTPGQGYMYYSTTAGARSLNYPTRSSAAAPRHLSPARAMLKTFSPVDHHLYSGNMCVVARVTYDGEPCAEAEVAVFADGECRTAEMTDTEGYAYFTIPGDNPVELCFYLDHGGEVLSTKPLLTYVTDAVYGTYQEPFAVEFGSGTPTALGFIPADAEGNRWFDLNGRAYETRPAVPGVYLLRHTDPTTGVTTNRKVVVK